MAFRYQPCTHPKPLLSPVTGSGEHPLTGAYRRLRHLNLEEDKLCTWSHGIINDWEEVPRYLELLSTLFLSSLTNGQTSARHIAWASLYCCFGSRQSLGQAVFAYLLSSYSRQRIPL
jgi:hypothetical protein